MSNTVLTNPSHRKAYIITGPTSGIGRRTALELAKHGMVVLVGRDHGKLDEVQKTIEQRGQHAVSVVCDLSDLARVRRAVWAIRLAPAYWCVRYRMEVFPPGWNGRLSRP